MTSVVVFILFFLYLSIEIQGHVQLLDSDSWRLSNSNGSITGIVRVPGGIYTDLRINGVLTEDPLYRYNDLKYRWVSVNDWNYSTTFNVKLSCSKNVTKYILVFDGIDTYGNVYLNKKFIGSTNNMFVKYDFPINEYLESGENVLDVIIKSPVGIANKYFNESEYPIPPLCVPKEYHGECHVNYLRKMQSSFGWDWGPAFPSMGIWKSVKLIMLRETILEDIKIDVATVNSSHWLLKSDTYMKCYQEVVKGSIRLSLNVDNNTKFINERDCCNEICTNDEIHIVVELYVPKTKIKLWWPNGYGEQKLYNLKVEFISRISTQTKTIKIGFRTAELIQELVDKNNVEKGLSFYFKINDVPIFAKGTNYIPSSVFPEQMNNMETIENLLSSARNTHMNMIRVWGGGVYESDEFYKICDKYGIMIWQDIMFACGMYPAHKSFLNLVKVEVKQQIRRLQYHPSIVLWAGNNENEAALRGNWYGTEKNYSTFARDYVKLYAETIREVVINEDKTRNYVLSSPSNGLDSEKENYIAKNPYSALYGDVHYYNYVVNSWKSTFYPWTRFASEYGYQSLPSYQTLKKALNEKDLSKLLSPALIHRQHLPVGYILMLLQIKMNVPVPKRPSISDYIFLSQVVQAKAIKTQTEWYRKNRNTLLKDGKGLTMGALYWQLNDVWQAPTWSSIDYDGCWKMLHYSAMEFFAPVIVVPELSMKNLTIHIVSDLLTNLKVQIKIEIYQWSSIKPLNTYLSKNINLISKIEQRNNYEVMVELQSTGLGLFVWLNVINTEGYFNENGFIMINMTKSLIFKSKNNISMNSFSVEINHLGIYFKT
ncbi:beta-mannosidase isoform X2 [Daktulosphaira vitifoliae]|uniref:beta-mannosidase isoform X2 n=1 Tax=Daktulosphaira vitifoliae TaxID=58002 RepID=UPI0021A9E8A0|nr:beta-mannosidase isoform X2 [Daktulosphaira vitifoliae]